MPTKKKSKLDKRKLEKLAKFIEKLAPASKMIDEFVPSNLARVKPQVYYQEDFFLLIDKTGTELCDVTAENVCQTAGCLAGWCCHLFDKGKLPSKSIRERVKNEDGLWHWGCKSHKELDTDKVVKVAAKHLGLTPRQASALFIGCPTVSPTPKQGARVLRILKETGLVDWYEATGRDWYGD